MRLLQHVARRLPHERVVQPLLAAQPEPAAHPGRLLGREHDRLDAAPLGLVHDRLAGPAGAHGRRRHLDALVLLPHGLGPGERLARRLQLLVRDPRVERQRHRDLEHPQRLDHRAALALVLVLLAREPPGGLHDVVVERRAEDGHEDRAELGLDLLPRQRLRRHGDPLEHGLALVHPVRHVEHDAERDPARAHEPRRVVQREHGRERDERERGAQHRGQRQLAAADAHVERHLVRAVAVGLAEAQPDHRQVDDRERERRAERVDGGEQLEVGRQHERHREQRAEPDQHDGRVVARVQPAEQRRDLAVERERVAQPREPEHGRVAGDHEERERRDDDQVAQRLAQPRLLERRRDAEHRRLVPVVVGLEQRRGGDERDPQVRHRRRRPDDEQPLQAAARDRDLAGERRGRVEPGERRDGDREREQEVLERRRARDRRRDRSGPPARTAARAPARRTRAGRRGRRR